MKLAIAVVVTLAALLFERWLEHRSLRDAAFDVLGCAFVLVLIFSFFGMWLWALD